MLRPQQTLIRPSAAVVARALSFAVAVVTIGCQRQAAERGGASGESRLPAAQSAAQATNTEAPESGGNGRRISFNGSALDERGWRVVEQLEALSHTKVPDGDYWYDAMSGAAGRWGGPAAVLLVPGLPLGGPLPAEASGGGNGQVTGIFVNGRELHQDDVRALISLYGQAWPGRWWVNGQGDFGPEGGAPMGNLRQAAAKAAQGAGGSPWLHGTNGGNGNFWTGGDGNGYVWANDSYSGCSYANDGGGVIC